MANRITAAAIDGKVTQVRADVRHEPIELDEKLRVHPVLRDVGEAEFAHFCAVIARAYLQGKAIKEIARDAGVSVGSVVDVYLPALRQQWLAQAERSFTEKMALELAKLDHLEAEYYAGWMRSQQPKTAQKQTHRYAKGSKFPFELQTETEQLTGDPRFLDGVHKCLVQRAKLIGLEPGTLSGLPSGDEQAEHDLALRMAKYASQFGVTLHITAADAPGTVDEQRSEQSLDSERSPSAAIGVSDIVDADWRERS